jgi:hypothetical protein
MSVNTLLRSIRRPWGISPSTRIPEAVQLAVILLLALGLRLVNLTHEAAWYDEIATLQYLRSGTLSTFLAKCRDLNPVPPLNLYLISEYYWGKYIGVSVPSERALSLVYGMGSLVALYGFTRSLLNTRTAALTVLWTALIPWHIYYSQEIRFYGLTTLLTILSMWTFARMTASASYAPLIWNGLFNWLLCRTHPLTLFLCVAQGLFLLTFRARRWRLIGGWSAIHAAIATSLYLFLTARNPLNIDAIAGWIPNPRLWGYQSSIEAFLKVTGGLSDINTARELVPFTPWGQTLHPAFPVLRWLLAAATLSACGYALWTLVRAKNGASTKVSSDAYPLRGLEKAGLLILWFLVPPLGLFAVSYLWRPLFVERYMIYATLPVYIAVGHGLASQRSTLIRIAALAVPVSLYFAFHFPGPNRTPFDKIAATIRENGDRDSVILTTDDTITSAIRFYWRGHRRVILDPDDSADVLSGRVPAPKECWLVLAPPRAEALAVTLKERGEVFGPWHFPSARPASIVRWLPAAQARTPE